MSIAVVVGMGSNSVEVPCLTFETVEAADTFLTGILGPANDAGYYGRHLSEAQIRGYADKFFRSYYDGCGGVWSFVIREVEHGQPIAVFNLD
jgi:hypothetical protein